MHDKNKKNKYKKTLTLTDDFQSVLARNLSHRRDTIRIHCLRAFKQVFTGIFNGKFSCPQSDEDLSPRNVPIENDFTKVDDGKPYQEWMLQLKEDRALSGYNFDKLPIQALCCAFVSLIHNNENNNDENSLHS